jgi:succinoglycan biosynthesis transport protein ExoP
MKLTTQNSDFPESVPGSLDLSQILVLLKERWWAPTAGVLIGAAIALWHSVSVTPVFSATATLQLEPHSRVLSAESEHAASGVSDSEIQLVLETLQSRPLLLETAKHLSAGSDSTFFGGPISLAEAAGRLPGHFQARARRGTPLITLSARHPNAESAARLANSLGEALLTLSQARHFETFKRSLSFLREETERLKLRLQKSEEALQNFRETHHAVSLEEKQDTVTSALKAEAANLASARASRIRLESDAAAMQPLSDDPEQLLTVASVAQHPNVVAQRGLIEELLSRVQTLRLRYTDKHPRMAEVREQLHEAESALRRVVLRIPETLQSEISRAVATEQSFQEAVHAQERESLNLNRQSIAYSVLAREVETDRGLYQAVLKRLKESDVELGLPQSQIRIFEAAQVPVLPDSRGVAKRLILGTLLGSLFCSALVLLHGALRGTWHSIAQLEEKTDLPVLACIPSLRGAHRRSLPLLHPTGNSRECEVARESFRALRTSLHSRRRNSRNRCLLFASALPNDGKTTCLLGYAKSLAQQGHRTLVLDGDLRRGTLSRSLLRNPAHPGFSQFLAGDCPWEDTIADTAISALRILPAGTPQPDTSEQLTQKQVGGLLAELREEFDYVLIDTPPVLAASDALILASAVDAVCVVTRYGATQQRDLLRALQLLADTGTPIEGLIFNAVSPHVIPTYYADAPRAGIKLQNA